MQHDYKESNEASGVLSLYKQKGDISQEGDNQIINGDNKVLEIGKWLSGNILW